MLLTATPHSGDDARFDRLLNLGALPGAGDELDHVPANASGTSISQARRRVRWQVVPPSAEETRLLDLLADYERAVLRRSR